MTHALRRAMDALYVFCAGIAGVSLVLISFVIPWGVFTRYVLNHAASWPEPLAILLTVVMTFFGAAACYRFGVHMRVAYVRDQLPRPLGAAVDVVAELLVLLVGLFMAVWGYSLGATTWQQSIAEFPALSAGITYLPIPLGGVCLMLFVLERLAIGRPVDRRGSVHGDTHATTPFD
ncbi:MAG TPA: TRAP transporter small permease [Acetobacteraceae bacterium]|uniref:TRAP transporter small permease n=1 Tax=Mycobacterium sp. TaxID=1785 RepID=UPI002C3F945F|nr:TRAP transporter small permease [Mycobacterium sp.]HME25690.1 TRAP transporter small permease [Acetobacteraceae bacterium]HME79233.1 TRAP transporter small permease [Mycobacterium sp.]